MPTPAERKAQRYLKQREIHEQKKKKKIEHQKKINKILDDISSQIEAKTSKQNIINFIKNNNILEKKPLLKENLLNIFSSYFVSITSLIIDAKISLKTLVRLDDEIRKELIDKSSSVICLIEYAKISLKTLLKLPSDIRKKLIDKSSSVISLIIDAKISLKTLLDLDSEITKELIDKSSSVIFLIMYAKISLETLLSLTPEIRAELYKNSSAVINFILENKISPENLTTEKIKQIILEDIKKPTQTAILAENKQKHNVNPQIKNETRNDTFDNLSSLADVYADADAGNYSNPLFRRSSYLPEYRRDSKDSGYFYLSEETFLSLPSEIKAELYENSSAVIDLIDIAKISLETFFSLAPETSAYSCEIEH